MATSLWPPCAVSIYSQGLFQTLRSLIPRHHYKPKSIKDVRKDITDTADCYETSHFTRTTFEKDCAGIYLPRKLSVDNDSTDMFLLLYLALSPTKPQLESFQFRRQWPQVVARFCMGSCIVAGDLIRLRRWLGVARDFHHGRHQS